MYSYVVNHFLMYITLYFLFLFHQLIEACVQNCGQRFHTEVGKYRFLNELIKLISSKVIIFLIITLFVVEGAVSWDSFTMVNDLFIVGNMSMSIAHSAFGLMGY